MSLYNFLLFHLRRHVKNLVFVLHHRFQTRPAARVFICIVSWCLEPLIKHILGILLTSLWSGILFLCQTISFVFWGRWFFSHFRSKQTFIVVCLYFEGTCIYKVMLLDISEQSISHAYQEIAACKTELQQAKRIRRNRQGLFILIYRLSKVNIVTFCYIFRVLIENPG